MVNKKTVYAYSETINVKDGAFQDVYFTADGGIKGRFVRTLELLSGQQVKKYPSAQNRVSSEFVMKQSSVTLFDVLGRKMFDQYPLAYLIRYPTSNAFETENFEPTILDFVVDWDRSFVRAYRENILTANFGFPFLINYV
jgi:hypothetical protein